MKKSHMFILILTGVIAVVAGWALLAGPEPFFVHCAAGVQKPVAELARAFEAETGVRVELNYSGTNVLLGQIDLTRKGDIYIPGDADYIKMAREKGLISDSKPLCYFVPVIMVQKGNPKNITGLADLARPGLKVGLGDPKAAAVGRLTPKILKKAGVDYEAVKKNLKLSTPTVNELAMAISLRTIDATVVWDSEAAKYAGQSEVIAIPPERNIVPTPAVGILTTAKYPKLARRFMNYLVTDKAKAVFKKYNYTVEVPK